MGKKSLGFGGATGLALLSAVGCSDDLSSRGETTAVDQAKLGAGCAALANAVTSTTGNVTVHAASLVDSYQSSVGAYGGSNVGSNAKIQAAGLVVDTGGVVNGTEVFHVPSSLAVVPVPAGATKLPRGATTPGNVNINTAADSITLAPGNYVVANLNVNSPGAIKISPPGAVSIWVTGSLNLGGAENKNGLPANLTFFMTSSSTVNVNSNGQLFGSIYAPSAAVALNSAVFGSVVGASVILNSGAAVHYDQSQACSTPPPVTATPPRVLPLPPNSQGCYVGTWNGWVSVPCTPYDQLPPELQRIPYIGGGQGVIPGYLNGGINDYGPMPGVQTSDPGGLKFAEVETTVVNIAPSTPTQAAIVDDCFNTQPGFCTTAHTTANSFSVQMNTNPFVSSTGPAAFPHGAATHPGWVAGDQAWDQFTIQVGGGFFSVCIWQNDFTQGKEFTLAANNAYIPNCVHVTGSGSLATQSRDLQPLDFVSVVGSAMLDANGTDHDLGIVVQLSFWDPAKAPDDYRGLYATVAPDLYSLYEAGKWTTASGTLVGEGGGSMARFNQASVLTRVVAGNCVTSVVNSAGQQVATPCPSTLPTGTATASTLQFTDESNNLNIVPTTQTALALTNDGYKNLEMQYLAATGSPAQCDATPHVFVRDYDQDNGSTPSNLNGQAFWESPDLILVPAGSPATAPPITQVVAGQQYSIWVGVHNDYGCADVGGVTARVRYGDAALASPVWTDVIATADNYFAATVNVPRFGSNFVGPIPWQAPATADPHECLVAIIKGASEPAPANVNDTPGSNQIAQRNIEIGNDCSWKLNNGTGANGMGTITLKTLTGTQDGQPYTPQPGDDVRIMFADPGGTTFAAAWPTPPGANPPYTVTNVNNVTTVKLISTGFVTLPKVALASGQSVNVSSEVIPALFSGTVIDLQIGAALTNGGTIPVVNNGASCQATATGPVP